MSAGGENIKLIPGEPQQRKKTRQAGRMAGGVTVVVESSGSRSRISRRRCRKRQFVRVSRSVRVSTDETSAVVEEMTRRRLTNRRFTTGRRYSGTDADPAASLLLAPHQQQQKQEQQLNRQNIKSDCSKMVLWEGQQEQQKRRRVSPATTTNNKINRRLCSRPRYNVYFASGAKILYAASLLCALAVLSSDLGSSVVSAAAAATSSSFNLNNETVFSEDGEFGASRRSDGGGHFTPMWAVEVPGGIEVADDVARHHGFINHGRVSDQRGDFAADEYVYLYT